APVVPKLPVIAQRVIKAQASTAAETAHEPGSFGYDGAHRRNLWTGCAALSAPAVARTTAQIRIRSCTAGEYPSVEDHAHNPVAGRLELPSDYVAGLLEATASLQLRAAERLVVEAARRFDAQTLLTEIFGPVLRAAGERWEQGQFSVLQEHLLSSAVRWQLLHALERWSGRPDGPAVAFTTLSGERHELGALMLAVVAARRGAQAIYL